MIDTDQAARLIGSTLIDDGGADVGPIGQLYLDDETGRPEWVTVRTGFFGTNESFVPVSEATDGNNQLRVPFSKDKIKNAPNCNPEAGHLSEQDESRLYSYYGMSYGGAGTIPTGTTGRDVSGPETDDAMTRSEERLTVGTEKTTAGTARLRKWIETENVNVSVPVKRQKARLVTEPVDESNKGRAMSGPELSTEEHEVTLTEERPVVGKETVPVERVRLETETEVGQETINEDVRKERIAAGGDVVDLNEGTRTQSTR